MRPQLYIRVSKNQIHVRDIHSKQRFTLEPEQPFSTTRLLVGEFTPFESCLRKSFKHVLPKRFFSSAPSVLIHATEMNEGGLCEIEKRALHEAALGAGARKVVIYEGNELSDSAVKEKL